MNLRAIVPRLTFDRKGYWMNSKLQCLIWILAIIFAPIALGVELWNVSRLALAGHQNWSALLLFISLTSRFVVTVYVHFSHTHRYLNYLESEKDLSGEADLEAFRNHWRTVKVPSWMKYAFFVYYPLGLGHVVPNFLFCHFKSRASKELRHSATMARVLFTLLNGFPLVVYYPYVIFSAEKYDWWQLFSWFETVVRISSIALYRDAIPLFEYKHVAVKMAIRLMYFFYNFFSLLLSVPIMAFLMSCTNEAGENLIPLLILSSIFALFLRIINPRYFLKNVTKHRGAYLLWWLLILIVPNLTLLFLRTKYGSDVARCDIPFFDFIVHPDNVYLSIIPAICISFFWIFETIPYVCKKLKTIKDILAFVKYGSLISAILFIFDFISDLRLGVEYIRSEDNCWSSLTFSFIILPALVNGIYGLCHYKRLGFFYARNEQSAFIIFMHVTGLAQLLWVVDEFLCHFYYYDVGLNAHVNNDFRTRKITTFELVTLFLEDLPQSCLQIYIIFKTGTDNPTTWLQIICIVTSLLSASKSLVLNGTKLFEKMFGLSFYDVDENKNGVHFRRRKRVLRPTMEVNYEVSNDKLTTSSKNTFKYKYDLEVAPDSSSCRSKLLDAIKNNYALLLLQMILMIAMFVNIFATITGVAYLCECGSEDGNRMVYLAFPVMIILRVLFPTEIVTPRWLKSCMPKSFVTWIVRMLVIVLPICIHVGMVSRAAEECVYVAIDFDYVYLHGVRLYDWTSFRGFMVMIGVHSYLITTVVGVYLITVWYFIFNLKNWKRECRLDTHVPECDCDVEQLLSAVRHRVRDGNGKDLGSLLRRNDMAKQFKMTKFLEMRKIDSSSFVEYCCGVAKYHVLSRLEILGILLENGAPYAATKRSFREIKKHFFQAPAPVELLSIAATTAGPLEETELNLIKNLFRKGVTWAMGEEESIGEKERSSRKLDLMYAMHQILAKNPTLIWFILNEIPDVTDNVKTKYEDRKTDEICCYDQSSPVECVAANMGDDENFANFVVEVDGPVDADEVDDVDFEERESQFIEELIVLVEEELFQYWSSLPPLLLSYRQIDSDYPIVISTTT